MGLKSRLERMARHQHARARQSCLVDAHRRTGANKQQYARCRISDIVVRTWGMVDGVPTTARRATFQAAELADEALMISAGNRWR